MNPTQQARTALGLAGIPAPTDAQVTRCIALAAWYLAEHGRGDGKPFTDADNEWTSAAADVAAESK